MSKESKAFDAQVTELTSRFEREVSRYSPDPTAAALAASIVAARETLKADATKADFIEMCESAWKLVVG